MNTHSYDAVGRSEVAIDIVEDDPSLADSLVMLLQSRGYMSRHFVNGERFLSVARGTGNHPRNTMAGCILLDLRLPTMSGLVVFDELLGLEQLYVKPVIFLTGHGDMELAVDVLTRGAFDFISKPFDSNQLLVKVEKAVEVSHTRRELAIIRQDVMDRINQLTTKEIQVMRAIMEGQSSREIAESSGNSIRTIELHRAHVLQKLGVHNAVELVSLVARCDLLEFGNDS
jgi:two-component system response regulator DctR